MRRSSTKWITVLLLVILAVMSLTACSSESRQLRFGTGNTEGTYYAYGLALAPILDEATGDVTNVISTTGSEGNLRLLATDMVDLGIAQSDTLGAAENSTATATTAITTDEDGVEINVLDNVSAIGSLYTEACQIITRADTGIETVEDLRGRKVSIGEEESGVTRNAEQILMAYGMTTDMLVPSRLSFQESRDALERGQIDAFFCTAGVPTKAVSELASRVPIRFVSMDERSREQLTSLYGMYVPYTIPKGTYEGQTDDVHTVGVRAVLCVRNQLDTDTVEKITAAIFSGQEELEQEVKVDTAEYPLTPKDASEGVPIGFHPGAAAYYESQGISVDVSDSAESYSRSYVISIDMYQTMALAVGILYLGGWLKKKWNVLEKFCIPSPVVGGLIFAIVTCVLYALGIVEFSFDETLRNVCMVIFFTSVGFQANIKVLRSGGKSLLIFLGIVVALIISQNVLAEWVSGLLGVDPMVGMCTGSIPMIGGHGTAGAFGPVLEDLGLPSATTLATAAATFGLVAGSLMGGPVGRRLIEKHDLLKTAEPADTASIEEDEQKHRRRARGYAPAAYQIVIAMGIGTVVSWLLSLTGMNFPIYIGSMIVAAVIRNWSEISGKFTVHMGEINDIGGICLSLFLGIAMITLKLWQLADLALPLIILLISQVGLMFVFSYIIVFNAMGRNYDAAVLAAGTCGFGMGATPNAMANMQAITEQYAPSVKAYILVPIVGSMFADFINSVTITFFINAI